MNALTFDMFDRIHEVADELDANPQVRTIVVTGAGRAFCAGLDLADAQRLGEMTMAENMHGQEKWARAITRLHTIAKPVIAAVNGAAAGAGFALALAADMRIASSDARFNAAFIRIGLSGGDCGTSYLLPRIVGLGIAHELLLTGRFVDSAEAARLRLVNRVVAPDTLIAEAVALAGQIVSNSPLGVHLTKQLINANVVAPSLAAALELENRSQVLAAHTSDMREALAAFVEKRPPVYVGR